MAERAPLSSLLPEAMDATAASSSSTVADETGTASLASLAPPPPTSSSSPSPNATGNNGLDVAESAKTPSASTPGLPAGSANTPVPLEFSYPIEDYTHPASNTSHDLKHSFSWDPLLSEADFVAAPVTAFKHAPMSDCWEFIVVGMKVEVENCDSSDSYPGLFPVSYWVASVLRISGYYALLRYEGFGQDGSKDFWMSVASDKIHPVGWCATKHKPLIPPKG